MTGRSKASDLPSGAARLGGGEGDRIALIRYFRKSIQELNELSNLHTPDILVWLYPQLSKVISGNKNTTRSPLTPLKKGRIIEKTGKFFLGNHLITILILYLVFSALTEMGAKLPGKK